MGTVRVSYNIFANNKTITSFREFKEFTGIIELWGSWALGQYGGFRGCSNLLHIEMPESLQILGDYAFEGCTSLQILEFGENLNDCRRECFKNLRCPIIIYATTPPALNTYDNGNAATFYVPDDSVDAYKAASGWSSWASRIKPLSEVTE